MEKRPCSGSPDIPISEPKCAFDLVDCCSLPHDSDITVESATKSPIYKCCIDEDECFLHVKADSDDVVGILESKLVAFLKRKLWSVIELRRSSAPASYLRYRLFSASIP